MDSKAKYLIVKGSGGGGLGDRLRSVLTAIIYAKLTNRIVYVDWTDGKLISQRRNVFYEYFQIKNIDFVTDCPDAEDVFPLSWQGKLDASLHELYQDSGWVGWDRQAAITQYSFDQRHLDYPQKVLVMWEFDQLSDFSYHYSKLSGNALMRNVAREFLTVKKVIADQVQIFRHQDSLEHESIIGVHIRATNEFMRQKNSVTLGQYVSQINHCIRVLKAENDKHQFSIFLATDNKEVERQLETKFPGRIRTREKWFAAPGEKIHFNDQCPDAEKSLNDAIVEICLLAESDYLIYQYNSSFGMMADYFFKADANNIFALLPGAGILSKVKAHLKNLMQ